ncbi:MAG: type II toxin-antitoxin system VapC family toxin [Solirubrobacteraceae bacterium]
MIPRQKSRLGVSATVAESRRIYWDACVFLSYINGHTDRLPIIDELLRLARADEFELLTSSLSHAEVAFAEIEKTRGQLDGEIEAKIDALWQPGSPIKTVEFYDFIGIEARQLMRQGIAQGWGALKPNDAMHLATAKRMEVAEMQTYDDRLLQWDGKMGFPIREPQLEQTTLNVG